VCSLAFVSTPNGAVGRIASTARFFLSHHFRPVFFRPTSHHHLHFILFYKMLQKKKLCRHSSLDLCLGFPASASAIAEAEGTPPPLPIPRDAASVDEVVPFDRYTRGTHLWPHHPWHVDVHGVFIWYTRTGNLASNVLISWVIPFWKKILISLLVDLIALGYF
jgi:hypothetical protein